MNVFDPLSLRGEYYDEEVFNLLKENGYKQIDQTSWLSPTQFTYIFNLIKSVGEHHYQSNSIFKLSIKNIIIYDENNQLIELDYSNSLPKINRRKKEEEELARKKELKECLKELNKLFSPLHIFKMEFKSFGQLMNELKKCISQDKGLKIYISQKYGITYQELIDIENYREFLPYQEFESKDGRKFKEIAIKNQEGKYEIRKWTMNLIIRALQKKNKTSKCN